MGVVTLPQTAIKLSDINKISAEAKLRNSSGFSGNSTISTNVIGSSGTHTRLTPADGFPFRGKTATPGGGTLPAGFRLTSSLGIYKHRYLIIHGENCTVGVSSPSVCKGVTWKAGSSPSTDQSSINAANSAAGYKLYLSGINYASYSSLTITASSFAYGYSAGSWVWTTEPGSFMSAGGFGNTSYTLYDSSNTSVDYAILKHVATAS